MISLFYYLKIQFYLRRWCVCVFVCVSYLHVSCQKRPKGCLKFPRVTGSYRLYNTGPGWGCWAKIKTKQLSHLHEQLFLSTELFLQLLLVLLYCSDHKTIFSLLSTITVLLSFHMLLLNVSLGCRMNFYLMIICFTRAKI